MISLLLSMISVIEDRETSIMTRAWNDKRQMGTKRTKISQISVQAKHNLILNHLCLEQSPLKVKTTNFTNIHSPKTFSHVITSL